jgi:hypothetical protein
MQLYLQLFLYLKITLKLKIAICFCCTWPSSGNCPTCQNCYTVFSMQLDELYPKLQYFNVFIFRNPLITRHLFENITCHVFMCCLPPAVSMFCILFCVAHMDVGDMLLSCF